MARTSQGKLTPVSVAVTDQMIGLFISALCEVHVTMHRLAQSTKDLMAGVSIQTHPVQLVVVHRRPVTDIVFSSARMPCFPLHALGRAGVPVESPTARPMRQVVPVHGYPVASTSMPDLTIPTYISAYRLY